MEEVTHPFLKGIRQDGNRKIGSYFKAAGSFGLVGGSKVLALGSHSRDSKRDDQKDALEEQNSRLVMDCNVTNECLISKADPRFNCKGEDASWSFDDRVS